MAKNFTYTRNLTDKLVIKGVVSDDGDTITYIGANDEEVVFPIEKCFSSFRGEFVEVVVSTKTNKDLLDEATED